MPAKIVAIYAKAPPTEAGNTIAMFSPSKARICFDKRIPAVSVCPKFNVVPKESLITVFLKLFFAVLIKVSKIIIAPDLESDYTIF
ncbi:MAG: hypothetical protein DPW17_14405 [Candidatus Jettenia sp.]|nr:hypothetical protein [Candidatus Jettenia sp.]